MSELVDVIYTAEVRQMKTLPTGKFKEVRDKQGRIIKRLTIFGEKEVVVPPPKKKIKYFDATEQRDKTAVIEFKELEDGIFHAFYQGAFEPGVAQFVAAKLVQSKNFKISKKKAPAPKDDDGKDKAKAK